ncbi:diamine N-acetyltransferase [Luminiphilus syltensis NOR5-1B]|uniref:Diamine N-acetyltransferase n=1 Tax=Luminiphilus syltensis NOR5-1B TaxID=565045 RepID=B8KT55_9GAMM|nr:GNAT family N-acetyltransferase [Luminiphilus syltensis]EED36725.1 diamine N-acetyltransferase [Luminiphilus syltensis NOR5-1B]
MTITVRKGEARDIPDVFRWVNDLALYEKAPEEVVNTEAQLLSHWQEGWFEFLVAESDSQGVGLALFYTRYSTWKGCCYYLEDLYVEPEFRGKGIGLALLTQTALEARQAGAIRLDWQVLDWNRPAIDFYDGLGAAIEQDWWNCKLDLDAFGR